MHRLLVLLSILMLVVLFSAGCSDFAPRAQVECKGGENGGVIRSVGEIISIEQTNASPLFYLIQLYTNLENGVILGNTIGARQLELLECVQTNGLLVGRCCLTAAGFRDVRRHYDFAPKAGDKMYVYDPAWEPLRRSIKSNSSSTGL